MTPEELNALADRVERLEGSDLKTDILIEQACVPPTGQPKKWLALRYTASIDAAMTLVPEGYDWSLDNFDGEFGKPSAWVHARRSAAEIVPVTGATPALALCSAALRARAALASENSNAE